MGLFNVTVKGGFWPTNGVDSFQGVSGENGLRHTVRQALGQKSLRELRERIDALLGVAPGATATATNTRVAASEELGGVRAIETEVLINRATTAADVTEIRDTILEHSVDTTFGPNPPPNLDRNPLGTR
jgi:hypothetical protein